MGWLAPGEPPPALVRLQGALDAALTAEGFPLEERAFQAHVTVLRNLRQPAPQQEFPALATALEFVLAAARREDTGPRYEILERFPAR